MATGKNKRKTRKTTKRTNQERLVSNEVLLLFLLAIGVLLFLCNFGIIGPVGNTISSVMFGLFGITAYIAPVFVFVAIAFGISNQGNTMAIIKLSASVVLFITLGVICELMLGVSTTLEGYNIGTLYENSSVEKTGGGIIAGSLAYLLFHLLDMAGSVLVIIVLILICIVIITGKSVISGVKEGSKKVYSTAKDDAAYRREQAAIRREQLAARRKEENEKRAAKENIDEAEKILRMDKKVSGVMKDTAIKESAKREIVRDDIHEITIKDIPTEAVVEREVVKDIYHSDRMQQIRIHTANAEKQPEDATTYTESYAEAYTEPYTESYVEPQREKPVAKKISAKEQEAENKVVEQEIKKANTQLSKKYMFPPISRLKKMEGSKGSSTQQLRETAMRLQDTLNTFGVKVTVTDISQGPSVTRYELQPETGVKVSKIVGLADDIKLNLAATDIRIEAPIPGKAAVGIEVPNKENGAVGLRELIESKEFKEFKSNLAVAVGKDISGKVVVADIAKMPHMLIAGSTGSGKSVCINTIIMSILYKAHPDDVKLIMVDPKVVELSVYNGIPHLMIPVVTDPKKAAAALHWGVAEMTERYKKFADFNVRDLAGYNKQVQSMIDRNDPDAPEKMPQIVIIVDELADLMMVAASEVEESICRLAQLARAAGIHLIIATQRPSVDVITGLIKANMPSRVAFAVSSGVDSRTILDMNGAEKLLGKGDMLFYPQGYSKPARVQGAFVSDSEVSDVVDFLKNQKLGNTYNEDVEEQLKSMGKGGSASGGVDGGSGNDRDPYFVDAGKFIIEKDKASIGMLQRVFKIGFNRAARIMDQLAEAGVVGEEEGTKPRKVLMSMEQFEQYIEEYV